MMQDFITLLRTTHNIKIINCLFLNFSLNIFGLCNKLGSGITDKGRLLYYLWECTCKLIQPVWPAIWHHLNVKKKKSQ